MSELFRQQFEPRYNIERPEFEDQLTVEQSDETVKIIEVTKRRKYHQTRRSIKTAYQEGEITEEKKDELSDALNRASQAELKKKIVREPNWEQYQLIDVIDWEPDIDLAISKLAQLPSGEILILDEQRILHIWDEDLIMELREPLDLGASNITVLQDGRVIYYINEQLNVFDPLTTFEYRTVVLDDTAVFATDGAQYVYYTRLSERGNVYRQNINKNEIDENVYIGHIHDVTKIYPDNLGRLLTLGKDGGLKITDMKTGAVEHRTGIDKIDDFTVGPKGEIYFISQDSDNIKVLELGHNENRARTITEPVNGRSKFKKIQLTPDNKAVLVETEGHYALILDVKTGHPIQHINHYQTELFITDDNRILNDGLAGTISIWGEY